MKGHCDLWPSPGRMNPIRSYNRNTASRISKASLGVCQIRHLDAAIEREMRCFLGKELRECQFCI